MVIPGALDASKNEAPGSDSPSEPGLRPAIQSRIVGSGNAFEYSVPNLQRIMSTELTKTTDGDPLLEPIFHVAKRPVHPSVKFPTLECKNSQPFNLFTIFTDHFGLVIDFLSECWSQLRSDSRLNAIQGRVNYGGALSGRDTTAVNRTLDGLLKLLYPDREQCISDEDLEWAVHLAMECRRRVKEQQKRVGSAEFRNTHFSYQIGSEGIEVFVVTPELQNDNTIGTDPLPPGQVWAISLGGQDESAGLYRIDVNISNGSGVKIINVPVPGPFRESIKYGEQNLLTRAKEFVGDREPRHHEFIVQLRAFDTTKNGAYLGLPAMLAFCSVLLGKSLKGSLIAVGGLNLGGGLDPVYNAVSVAEIAIEKGATILLIPISARKQLNELSDEMAVKISILFYADAREALLKALID